MKKLLIILTTIILFSGIGTPKQIVVAETDCDIVLTWESDEERAQRLAGQDCYIEEQANAEAERQAQEEAARKAAEEAARAEAERKAAEEAAKAEAERKAAEAAAKAEAERKAAEEAAKAEAARKAAEEAAKKAEEEKQSTQEKETSNSGKTGNNTTPDVTLADAQKNSSYCKASADSNCGDIYDGKHGLPNYSGGGVDEMYDTSEIEQMVYEKLNAMRAEMGLVPLVKKEANARAWAEVMATTGLFEHAIMNSSRKYSDDYKCDTYTCSGENILINSTPAKYATVEQIAEAISQQWNNSPGHYSNRTQSGDHYSMNDGDGEYLYYDIAIVRSLTGQFWAVERFGGDIH